jgi:hypothetical protein
MATAIDGRPPPFPPFTRDSAMQKVRLAEARAPEGGPFLDRLKDGGGLVEVRIFGPDKG